MTVAFVSDYSLLGKKAQWSGAQVSTSLLTEGLQNAGVTVVTVIPGESWYRQSGKLFRPLMTASPIWFLYSAAYIWRVLQNQPVEILHVQGKNNLVGAFLANLLLRKKLVVTVRDYRLLCDLGMCLLRGEKVCGWWEYLTKDIPYFVKHYHRGLLTAYVWTYSAGIYTLLLRPLYLFVLSRADRVICLSKAQQEIYERSKVTNTEVIYNPVRMDRSDRPRKKQIFFGGRYSLGKGKEILEDVLPRFLKKHPDWKYVAVGAGTSQGQVSYPQYLKLLKDSSLALVPSVWPEPFGRAALDALGVGTPVIASSRGGLPEIVQNGTSGLVVPADSASFTLALEKGVKETGQWQENIRKAESRLREKFETGPVDKHVELYHRLLT